jgi:ribose transport system ATP-binding protein
VDGGWLRWKGQRVDLDHWSPAAALRNGFALLPVDRRREGGVGEASLRENITLSKIDSFWRAGWLQVKAERERARELLELFQVRPPDSEALFQTLSGGNQQKTLLAKELFRTPQVFLLVEPTHGIDVGAKVQVMRMVRDYAEAGHVVVIASSEYEEVAALCNRVAVLREGRLVAELAGADVTREGILACCYA